MSNLKEKWPTPLTPEKPAAGKEKDTSSTPLSFDIESLKSQVERWLFQQSLLKSALENVEKMDESQKPFYIGILLYWLNKKWISMEIVWWKVKLISWKQNISENLKIAWNAETKSYESLFNNYISEWKISIDHIKKAILYKSSWLRSYLFEKPAWQKTSLTEYVVSLLGRYKNLTFNDDQWKPIDVSTPEWVQKLKWVITWMTAEKYKEFRALIKEKIVNTDPSDRDFLLSYFDDVRDGGKNMGENAIEEYRKNSKSIWAELVDWLSTLDDDTLFAMWIKNPQERTNLENMLKNDPFWLVWEMFSNQNGLLVWFILWILWFIFWKDWRKLMTALWLFWAWVVWATGWLSYVLWSEVDNPWRNSYITRPTHNMFADRVFGEVPSSLDQEKLRTIYDNLLSNDKFLSSSSINLKIFDAWTPVSEQEKYFKSIWITDFNDETKEYYKHIFANILKQRQELIWEPSQVRTMKGYFEAKTNSWTDNTQNSNAQAPVVAWQKPGEWAKDTKEVNRFKMVWYIENWKYHIIWPDWKEKLVSFSDITPEFRQHLEKFQSAWKMTDNLLLILRALEKKNPWDDNCKKISTELETRLKKLDISSSLDVGTLLAFIAESWNKLWLKFQLSDDVKVFDYVRSLDYWVARSELVEKLFDWTWITEEDLRAFIENPYTVHTKIQQLVWPKVYIELWKEVEALKSKANIYFWESRSMFISQVMSKNNVSRAEAERIVDSEYKDMVIWAFVNNSAKDRILEAFVEKDKNTGKWFWYDWNNDLMKMYWNIAWVWLLKFSDKSESYLKEAFIIFWTELIALWAWAVTLWAWTVAVNAAVWWTRWSRLLGSAYRLSEAANAWNKLAKLGRFWAMSVLEWSAFYGWYGLTQKYINWQEMSLSWLWESIAFAWAFRALSAIPWFKLIEWVPLSQQKMRLIAPLPVYWLTLSWVSWWIDSIHFENWITFEPWEWTAEMFIQAFIMATFFRWVQWLNFKIKSGRVEATTTWWAWNNNSQSGPTPTPAWWSWNNPTPQPTPPRWPSTLSRAEIKAWERFISQKIDSIKPWESANIGWLDVKNTWTTRWVWKYIYDVKLSDWTIKTWTKEEILQHLNAEAAFNQIRQAWNFKWIISDNAIGKSYNVKWHNVKFNSDWTVRVEKPSASGWRDVLTWQALDDFVHNNFWDILKKVWVDIQKIPNPKVEEIKWSIKSWVSKLEGRSEKTWYDSLSSKIPAPLRYLISDILRPWRSVSQILDSIANTPWFKHKAWEILKVLTLWERSPEFNKLWIYARLAFNAWVAWWVAKFIEGDDLWPEEFIDAVLYNVFWLAWYFGDRLEQN